MGKKRGSTLSLAHCGEHSCAESFLSIMKKQNFHLAIESFELIAVGSRAG